MNKDYFEQLSEAARSFAKQQNLLGGLNHLEGPASVVSRILRHEENILARAGVARSILEGEHSLAAKSFLDQHAEGFGVGIAASLGLEKIEAVNSIIAEVLGTSQEAFTKLREETLAHRVLFGPPSIVESLPKSLLHGLMPEFHGVASEISGAMEASRLAAVRLAGFTSEEAFTGAVAATLKQRDAIQEAFLRVTASYEDLFTSGASFKSLPSVVWEMPPVEVLRNVDLFDSLSITPELEEDADEDESSAARQFDAPLIKRTELALEDVLSNIDAGLVTMLHGAKVALASQNPDRARHVSTSLRELYTHVVLRLAPDEAVKRWTRDPKHYHQGRPTRQARLEYICAPIACEPFDECA